MQVKGAATSGHAFNSLRDIDVLHDWDDDRAVKILCRCRNAMAPKAKLLVIERIAPQHFCDSPHDQGIARSDLNMLDGTGGRERTETQYRDLLDAANLRITHVLPLDSAYSAIESTPIKDARLRRIRVHLGQGGERNERKR